MDDEAEYLDLLELYEEVQPTGRANPDFDFERWINGHLFMTALAREVRGPWWERDDNR